MRLDSLDLIRLALPLRHPFRTVSTSVSTRSVIIVRAVKGDSIGWGEASPFPNHTPDSIDDAWSSLCDTAQRSHDGRIDLVSDDAGTTSGAALDGALTTLRAAADHTSLAEAIGAVAETVRASASVGLHDSIDSLLGAFERALNAGYRCMKVKVVPGMESAISELQRQFPRVEIGLDANGSFNPADLVELRKLDESDLAFIEQPFPVGMERESSELAATLNTSIALDESIASLADVRSVLSNHRVDVLTLKPARLGITGCLAARDLAIANGVEVRIGGMLESGVGRAIGAALAACEGFTVFGDISGTGWHFETDVADVMQHAGEILVPSGDGLGLDVIASERLVVDRATYTWAAP